MTGYFYRNILKYLPISFYLRNTIAQARGGRIYNKFCNLKTNFRTAVGKYVNNTPKKKNCTPRQTRINKNFGINYVKIAKHVFIYYK